jgi:predicted TIM-barrel fold metal-dependent hydrolase
MIVDAHVHAWTPRSEQYPWQPLGNLAPEVPWTIEEQVAAMARVGIDRAVLVQMSWYGYDNRYLLDCARRYPGMFGIVGMVDPALPDVAERMDHLLGAGVRGFRLVPRLRPELPWYHARLWSAANERNTILTLLVGPEQGAAIEPVLGAYPHVTVVIDHLARPDTENDPNRPLFRRLLALARYPNLYLKVSAFAAISHQPFPYADVAELLRQAWHAYGPERLMWGSDYAMARDLCSMEDALAAAEQALVFAPAVDRDWILGGTAARLWALT